MEWQLSLDTIFNLLGMLSSVIIVLVKLKPGLDDYFRQGTPILAEIDDVIDAILLTFLNNKTMNTIDDLLDKIIEELKQAGYKVNNKEKKKIENRLKARLRREKEFKLKFNSDNNRYEIKYTTDF
ncbi:hypothetical protein [Halanaerobaculum tunisiense]